MGQVIKMAFLCLRFIGAVPVSIVTEEEHESTLTITRLPIEFGADVTDHAYVEPRSVTIRGLIGTGTPGFLGSFISAAGYQALTRYQKSRVPFTLITGLDFYRDMLIESITVPRTTDNVGVLEFTARLRQIVIVGSGFNASTLGAISGGQAAALGAVTLAAGLASRRASPTVKRGDNVVRPANTDDTTVEGRRNNAAIERVGL